MSTMNEAAKTRTPATAALPAIHVYNTLSRKKELLEPVEPGKVGIYLCGPTVYKPSHVGHMVGPVIFDAVKRYLTYCGYEVRWIVNITDVDDKLIAESSARGIKMSKLADEMTADYMDNLKKMGIDTVDAFPKATDNIGEIIALTQALVDKGFAYESAGDVYFDVAKDPDYGKLSHRNVDELEGEGGEMASRKRSQADFALWKSAKPGEPSWDSPWGKGRPGWHIECSAMSRKELGETFDIHGGGLDLVFPHHENEIAQSECCHGRPQAKYWMHNGLMQATSEVGKLGGRHTREQDAGDQAAQEAGKMGKSKGASAFSELLTRHQPENIRFFLLSTHYRRPIDFSEERIEEVGRGLEAFYRFFGRYQRITGESFYDLPIHANRPDGDAAVHGIQDAPLYKDVQNSRALFLAAMDDDFNTGNAIGQLYQLVRRLNGYIDFARLDDPTHPNREQFEAQAKYLRQATIVLRELAATLGLFRQPVVASSGGNDALVSELVNLLIELRADARKQKNFAWADRIRDRLGELGVVLADSRDGTRWSLER